MATTKKAATPTVEPTEQKEHIITTKRGSSNTKIAQLAVPPSNKVFRIKMGQLISLANTGIPNAKLAMRNSDPKHLSGMFLGDRNQLPPLQVQNSDLGLILWDGYHRFAVYLMDARLKWHKAKQTTDFSSEDFDALDFLKNLPEPGLEEQKFIDDQPVTCVASNFKTHQELLNAAFAANLAHGLPTSTASKCRYALWLVETEGLSLRSAAKRVNLTHVAVMHYRDAKVRKTEEGYEQSPQEKAQEEAKAAEKAATAFIRNMRIVANSLKKATRDEAAMFMLSYVKNEDLPHLELMVSVFTALTEEIAEQAVNEPEVQALVNEAEEDFSDVEYPEE